MLRLRLAHLIAKPLLAVTSIHKKTMKLFDFFRSRVNDMEDKNRLLELLERNYDGKERASILNELNKHTLVLGSRHKLPNVLECTIALTFLASSSPVGKGESLMGFISEDDLAERNKDAYPASFDIHAINELLLSSDLQGLIINYHSGWCYFPKEELIKATANHT